MSRELDARVAREVMEWKPCGDFPFPPLYSTDMNAAMEVVEKMRERGWRLCLWSEDRHKTYSARFNNTPEEIDTEWYFNDTPALAICLAALDAVAGK